MKRFVLVLGVLLITGCALSDDITPPPSLATAQAIQPGQVATIDTAGVPPMPPAVDQLEPPDATPDLDSGFTIYMDKCVQCHGPEGMGDGDMAANLETPPPALGDPDIARQVVPADWYTIITQGRMEMFMPPFASLTDQERWDVTGYVLSLGLAGEDLEMGAETFAANCAECHSSDEAVGGALVDPALLADSSRRDVYQTIERGLEGMPGFGGDLSQEDIWALAGYVQHVNMQTQAGESEATSVAPTAQASQIAETAETESAGQPAGGTPSAEVTGESEPTQAVDEGTSTPTETVLGIIEGRVIQGTSDADMPGGLTAQLIGIEGNAVVVDQETPVDSDGGYRFEDLEGVPGRLYAVVVEYEGVPYFSEGVHLAADEPVANLPVVIHEVTRNTDQLLIDRVHLIADPSPTGQVIITELWLVINVGDRTIFDPEGGASMQVALPEGFTALEFYDESAEQRYRATDSGFNYSGSLVPGFENELVFSFTLDLDSRLDFEQPVDYPIGAVVALIPEGGLTLNGEEVVDRGVQNMGGTPLHTYNLPAVEAGGGIEFRLRRSGPTGEDSDTSSLVIGLAVLGVGLVTAGLLWYRQSQSSAEEPELDRKLESPGERDRLLRQIAELDDAFYDGEVDQASYTKQRTQLKEKARRLMQDDG